MQIRSDKTRLQRLKETTLNTYKNNAIIRNTFNITIGSGALVGS